MAFINMINTSLNICVSKYLTLNCITLFIFILCGYSKWCIALPIEGTDTNLSADRLESERNELKPPTARIVLYIRKRSTKHPEPWFLNSNICPPSLCPSSDSGASRPRGTGGSVFYNGDIVLDKEAEKIIYGNSYLYSRYKRATTRNKSRLWKDAVVPYTFGDDLLPTSRRAIKKAMKHIEKNTCIRFRSRKLRDEDYIRFISEPGCWSNVGRLGGEQRVSLGRGCERVGTAVHEISHALGFWHEHARPDRDLYVKIIEENVSPRYLPDFEKIPPTLSTGRGYPYDYESVMHYSEFAFTNLGEKTIKVIGVGKKLGLSIGQRNVLSTLDISQLREMYKCNDKEDDQVTVCPNKWKKFDRSCYKFESKLKYQFAAAQKHCDQANSYLVAIDSKREEEFIRKRILRKYKNLQKWRTGGKQENGTFGWYRGDNNLKEMVYTNWQGNRQPSFSSLVIRVNKTTQRLTWEGDWLGSASQYPFFAYPFICESRAKRECIPGQFADGRDYRGKLDHTIDGVTCQKWSDQYPHEHTLLPYPYKNTAKDHPDGLGDHNYCRNPSDRRRNKPWCYTGKKNITWQYCDITVCNNNIPQGDQPVQPEKQSNKKNKHDKCNKTNVQKEENGKRTRKDKRRNRRHDSNMHKRRKQRMNSRNKTG